MQKEDIKFHDSVIFEGMTSIRAIIKGYESGINDRKIEKILFDKKKLPKIAKEIGYLRAISENFGFYIEESSADELEKITLGTSHGGIVAVTGNRKIPYLDSDSPIKANGFYAMIEGIEDPYNFGYAIRSLYAMGCDGIILSERNWLSAAGVVSRSSAGASELTEFYTADPLSAVDVFKCRGYSVICADERTDNLLGECKIPFPVLLIVGGEKRGISRSLVDCADMLLKIDYGREFRASLSAASAATMFAYEIARQRKLK